MRNRPPHDSRRHDAQRDDSQRDDAVRTAAKVDTEAALDERAVAAARAELRGERTGILGATGRLSLPRLKPPRQVPERWSFIHVMDRLEEAFRTLRRLPIATRPRGYVNPGGGNFTMPDLRGRFFFNLDTAATGGRISTVGGNFDGTVLGNTGGVQSGNISQNQLPNVAPASPSATFIGTQSNYTLFSTSGNPATVTDTVSGTGFAIGGSGWRNIGAFAQGTPLGTISVGAVGSINGGVSQQLLSRLPPAMGINCMMRIA